MSDRTDSPSARAAATTPLGSAARDAVSGLRASLRGFQLKPRGSPTAFFQSPSAAASGEFSFVESGGGVVSSADRSQLSHGVESRRSDITDDFEEEKVLLQSLR